MAPRPGSATTNRAQPGGSGPEGAGSDARPPSRGPPCRRNPNRLMGESAGATIKAVPGAVAGASTWSRSSSVELTGNRVGPRRVAGRLHDVCAPSCTIPIASNRGGIIVWRAGGPGKGEAQQRLPGADEAANRQIHRSSPAPRRGRVSGIRPVFQPSPVHWRCRPAPPPAVAGPARPFQRPASARIQSVTIWLRGVISLTTPANMDSQYQR